MAIRTGAEYRGMLARGRDLWIGSSPVADVLGHDAFRGSIDHVARLYDAQHLKDHREMLVDQDAQEGPVGMTFLRPRCAADIQRRRKMMAWWADQSAGMMGRTGDYVGTMVTAWAMQAPFFGERAANVIDYFNYCRRNDLFLIHALIDPQLNRSVSRSAQSTDAVLRVVGETAAGPIVRGVKTIGTSAAIADEVVVWPLPVPQSESERDHALAFAIPLSTPGLKLVCRSSYGQPSATADFPLSSRFDEVDAVLIFDDVQVPWERVFIYKDVERLKAISKTRMRELTAHQTNVRLLSKMEFIYGVLCLMAESIGLAQTPAVQETLGEAASFVETLRSLIVAAEAEAAPDPETGYWYPSLQPLQAGRLLGPRTYPRLIEMIRRLGAGGLMQAPRSIADFSGPHAEWLNRYCTGAGDKPVERAKLLKLAWDLCGTEFGSRHVLYEMFYSGDPSRLAVAFQNEYPKQRAKSRVQAVIHSN